jgi:hypothetical protein
VGRAHNLEEYGQMIKIKTVVIFLLIVKGVCPINVSNQVYMDTLGLTNTQGKLKGGAVMLQQVETLPYKQ